MPEKTVMTRFRTSNVKGSLRRVAKLGKGSSFMCLPLMEQSTGPSSLPTPAQPSPRFVPPDIRTWLRCWPTAGWGSRICEAKLELGRGNRKSREARTRLTFLLNFQSAWSFINKGKVTGDTAREAGRGRTTGRGLGFIVSQQEARELHDWIYIFKRPHWLLCRE